MRKLTTYLRPSILDQFAAGKGRGSEISDLLAKLERERASAKTLKRLRRVLSGRLWQTFNTPPVATWMPVAILVETPAWLNNEQQEP